MLRKAMFALMAMASVSLVTVDAASARGGFGGGGFHGGGFGGGGFHGGGFGGGGFRGGGFGGGGFRGGGFGGGGFRGAAISGGGFRSGAIGGAGFRSAAFAPGAFRSSHAGFRNGFHSGFRHRRGFPIAAIGFGLGYGYYDDYYGYGDYGYGDYGYGDYGYDDSSYYGEGGCYIVRQRVRTSHGWRVRPIQVCN